MPQCEAMKSDKSRRCRRKAVTGARVCYVHGGAAPQVKRGARERLSELAVPAVKGLKQIIKNKKDPTNRVKASIAVLDRTGFGAKQTIEVETNLIPFDKLSLELREMIVKELDVLEADRSIEGGEKVVELLPKGEVR